jgi:hypothetical protein
VPPEAEEILKEIVTVTSSHTAWLAVIGIVTGILAIWTFYKDVLQGAAVSLFVGDSIDFVRSSDSVIRKVHVACTFSNGSRRQGLVTKVILVLRPPTNDPSVLNWQMFYRYEGGHKAQPDSKVCPIPVPGNGIAFQGIEFQSEKPITLVSGTYRVQVLAWSESAEISGKPDIKDEFELGITNEFVTQIGPSWGSSSATLHTVMIKGREVVTAAILH